MECASPSTPSSPSDHVPLSPASSSCVDKSPNCFDVAVQVEKLLYEEQVASIDIRDIGNSISKLAKEGLTKGYKTNDVTILYDKITNLKKALSSLEQIHSKKRELGDVIDEYSEKPQGGFALRPRRFKKKKLMWDALKENKADCADGVERRVCSFCGTTRSSEWRRGPAGTKSLCNACGLHYSKILKKEHVLAVPQTPKVMSVTNLIN